MPNFIVKVRVAKYIPALETPDSCKSPSAMSATNAVGKIPNTAIGIAESTTINTDWAIFAIGNKPNKEMQVKHNAKITKAILITLILPNLVLSTFTG